jgi:hypothetical protein
VHPRPITPGASRNTPTSWPTVPTKSDRYGIRNVVAINSPTTGTARNNVMAGLIIQWLICMYSCMFSDAVNRRRCDCCTAVTADSSWTLGRTQTLIGSSAYRYTEIIIFIYIDYLLLLNYYEQHCKYSKLLSSLSIQLAYCGHHCFRLKNIIVYFVNLCVTLVIFYTDQYSYLNTLKTRFTVKH